MEYARAYPYGLLSSRSPLSTLWRRQRSPAARAVRVGRPRRSVRACADFDFSPEMQRPRHIGRAAARGTRSCSDRRSTACAPQPIEGRAQRARRESRTRVCQGGCATFARLAMSAAAADCAAASASAAADGAAGDKHEELRVGVEPVWQRACATVTGRHILHLAFFCCVVVLICASQEPRPVRLRALSSRETREMSTVTHVPLTNRVHKTRRRSQGWCSTLRTHTRALPPLRQV
jgi:hypothetical protein